MCVTIIPRRCEECGAVLDMEMELDGVLCLDCIAEAAGGLDVPDTTPTPLFTAAELDAMCGVSHRRKAS
jgi:hypothetical protein